MLAFTCVIMSSILPLATSAVACASAGPECQYHIESVVEQDGNRCIPSIGWLKATAAAEIAKRAVKSFIVEQQASQEMYRAV